MSIFEVVARFLGMTNEPQAGSAGATPAAGGVGPQHPVHPSTQGVQDPYADLWRSIEAHLSVFMTKSVLPHRKYAKDDVFNLKRMQVCGVGSGEQETVQRFLDEFRADVRRQIVLAAVSRCCSEGVSSEGFVDLNRDFDQAELDESDPYASGLAGASDGGYRVTLYGEWVLQQPVPSSAARGAVSAGTVHSPIELQIDDAAGTRQVSVESFPQLLGRGVKMGDKPLMGTFLSRRHGLLDWESSGRLVYRDTSVNGSMVDGVHTTAGESRELHPSSCLVLGGAGAAPSDCPVITVIAGIPDGAQGGKTPVRAPIMGGSASTPVRASLQPAAATPLTPTPPAPTGRKTLCLLAVQDAKGSRTVAVTGLPFVIGRGESSDYQVPEGNAGVSREHLVLEAIDSKGATVLNRGAEDRRWGTSVDGAEQPGQFVLAWNSVAVLAPRYREAPSVRVHLLSAGA